MKKWLAVWLALLTLVLPLTALATGWQDAVDKLAEACSGQATVEDVWRLVLTMGEPVEEEIQPGIVYVDARLYEDAKKFIASNERLSNASLQLIAIDQMDVHDEMDGVASYSIHYTGFDEWYVEELVTDIPVPTGSYFCLLETSPFGQGEQLAAAFRNPQVIDALPIWLRPNFMAQNASVTAVSDAKLMTSYLDAPAYLELVADMTGVQLENAHSIATDLLSVIAAAGEHHYFLVPKNERVETLMEYGNILRILLTWDVMTVPLALYRITGD